MEKENFEIKRLSFLMLLLFFASFLFLKATTRPKIVIVCAGDSLMRPMPLYLRRWLPGRYIAIKEWAQGGLSVASYFSFFSAHPAWRREKVDLILLQLGTNDVSLFLRNEEKEEIFVSHFRKIIKEFQKLKSNYFHRPRIIVATAPPFSGGKEEDQRNGVLEAKINPAIKKLAKKEKLFLLDHWPKFKGRPDLYDPDGVHLNSEGEKVMARQWCRIIRRVWLALKVRSYQGFLLEF
jgi:lysophospholipase L1-like esterase